MTTTGPESSKPASENDAAEYVADVSSDDVEIGDATPSADELHSADVPLSEHDEPPTVEFSPGSIGYAPPPHVPLGKSYDGVAFGGLFLCCVGFFCGGALLATPGIILGIVALVGMGQSRNRAGKWTAIAAILIGTFILCRNMLVLIELRYGA